MSHVFHFVNAQRKRMVHRLSPAISVTIKAQTKKTKKKGTSFDHQSEKSNPG